MLKIILFLFLINWKLISNAETYKQENAKEQLSIILKKNLPKLNIDTINNTSIDGIYEVISGNKVIYVDKTGRYAFIGNLVDLEKKYSITEKTVTLISKVDWNKLPLKFALRLVIGNGDKRIAVFTDPECPFCKRLEQETLIKLNNVTIYYFLYPLSIHKDGIINSEKILCSENPLNTYLNYMKKNISLPNKVICNNTNSLNIIKTITDRYVHVDETPTIVLPNGDVAIGLMPAEYLIQLINESADTIRSTPKAP